ncbi:DNA-binding transcriptional regulator, LysR family [Streptosporangium subroseum]|uniref:DNA-binding transcriptional regulator, LysR family n=1 Tax=Streptosporangium subroseum TaxID=106412 RepID=A0A239LYU9_9ACTN|nr:LysR family transcriptional regulator [Streptosporangium subroseum]SNT35048.1 DNA-binding transcriptional regulator, LysR family [Streptosporangium subroseum]
MTLRIHQLECFIAVAEHGHVTRAAQSLFVTQPALSSQIRALEAELGVALFSRHAKGVDLTPAGEVFLPHVRASLLELEHAVDAARAAATGVHSVVRVGLIVGTQVDVISRVLRAFRQVAPGSRIEFVEYTFDKPSAGLRAGETDVAFVVLPMHEEDLSFMPLEQPGVVATLFDEHPLSNRSSVSISEILDEPWVSTDTPDEICRGYWLAASHRVVPPVVHHRVRTMDKFIQLVAAAEAVGIAPAWVERNYQGRPIRFIPVIDVESPTVALAWREGEDASPAVVHMRGAARAALGSSGDLRPVRHQSAWPAAPHTT